MIRPTAAIACMALFLCLRSEAFVTLCGTTYYLRPQRPLSSIPRCVHRGLTNKPRPSWEHGHDIPCRKSPSTRQTMSCSALADRAAHSSSTRRCPYRGSPITNSDDIHANRRRDGLLIGWALGSSSGGAAAGGGGDESNALLMRMDFEDAEVEELRHWIRRYPFGVALPVQPFSLVETEMGVDVIFRKKPTIDRGSQDGGLSFQVQDSAVQQGVDLPTGPTLILRRISEGQEIRKMFAERIVVKAVVKALAGGGSPSAPAGTKVRAVLHEGLV